MGSPLLAELRDLMDPIFTNARRRVHLMGAAWVECALKTGLPD
jgi:hypothetical protein